MKTTACVISLLVLAGCGGGGGETCRSATTDSVIAGPGPTLPLTTAPADITVSYRADAAGVVTTNFAMSGMLYIQGDANPVNQTPGVVSNTVRTQQRGDGPWIVETHFYGGVKLHDVTLTVCE